MMSFWNLLTNNTKPLFVGIMLVSLSSVSLAQSPGAGADMWTGQMQQRTLFRPHAITTRCNTTTEAYVQVPFDPANLTAGVGFCIEKNQRSADTWENARNTCASLGKRLPEPGEFKLACLNAGILGLNSIPTASEWASNFLLPVSFATNNFGYSAASSGDLGDCLHAGFGQVLWYNGATDMGAYRCVR